MKENLTGFLNRKIMVAVACGMGATMMTTGPGHCESATQAANKPQVKPQVRIQAHAQTLPSFGGGGAAATDSGEEKSFRILTVKHIPARGVAYLFKDAEVIPTEIFVQPAGGGFGGQGGFGGGQGGFGGGQGGFGGGGGFGGQGGFGGGGLGGGGIGGGGGFGGGGGGGFGGQGGFGGGGFGF